MKKITAILHQYAILPQSIIRVTNRLYQIKANGKQYALKRSKMKKDNLEMWLSVYDIANKNELYAVLPLYLTKQNQLYTEMEEELYYLTPWIEGNSSTHSKDALESILRQLGMIHLRTKKIYKLKKDDIEKQFLPYQEFCKDTEKQLLEILEAIEKKLYPSPYELQVLTHFRDVVDAVKISQQLVDRIILLTDSEPGWGTSLTHGSLQKSHLFEHYLINWEQASFKHASLDLNDLFKNESADFGVGELLLTLFPAYLEENPFGALELAFLALYLLNPMEYLNLVKAYLADRNRSTMVEQTIKLEYAHRRLYFARNFYHQMGSFESSVVAGED